MIVETTLYLMGLSAVVNLTVLMSTDFLKLILNLNL